MSLPTWSIVTAQVKACARSPNWPTPMTFFRSNCMFCIAAYAWNIARKTNAISFTGGFCECIGSSRVAPGVTGAMQTA